LTFNPAFYNEFSFKGIRQGRFGVHRRGYSDLKPGIALPVGAKAHKGSFQASLLRPAAEQKTPDGFVEELIDGTPLNLAQIFQRGALFRVDP
jgi:hypothetical protein